ncbi:FeoB-associated Cys-rich membrane protein [Pseudoxanthomonas sp. SGD-10]|nr:FeoB-associated Cys-rich membrane protein [Pseudoxanthomonas sp. SGD-10]
MEIQTIITAVIFVLAIAYVANMAYRNLNPKKSCSNGCGKCGVDFSDKQVNEK